MSIRQILQVWEHEFSHPHQSVMLALADHAHEDGTGIRPSINRIAWKTGYSERSVQNILSQLRQLGMLVIAVPATYNTPNEYKFDWSAAMPKPAFDDFIAQKKGQKSGGAKSAPLPKSEKRGAAPVKQGCSRDETGVQLPCNRGAVAVQEGCSGLHPIRKEPSREPSIETKAPKTKELAEEPKGENLRFGMVTYQRPPDEIDFADLWTINLGMTKMELRAIAPGHKRLEMVAYGFGHWWVGPGLNGFDEHLIQSCRNRKRKFQQPDSINDAKTFINNMIRNGDWANFALRCDEASELKKKHLAAATPQPEKVVAAGNPFERTSAERRASALGLARFKVTKGNVAQALAISKQFGFSSVEIGLTADRELGVPFMPQAA
ncbi:MAG: helix-turn-helix domain-containing protein [Phormidesmis sp.]